MEDGRKIIDDAYQIIKAMAEELGHKKGNYSEEAFASLQQEVEASLTWAKKCRNKVWLRSKEGTELAAGCLEAANLLKEKFDELSSASEASTNLLLKLEALAKIIATKASVMT